MMQSPRDGRKDDLASMFDRKMNAAQKAWRERHVRTTEYGSQNGLRRPWILPRCDWEEGLWPGIRSGTPNSLRAYVGNDIQMHPGVHNLKSSWVLCANLYFAHRHDPGLLATFLSDRIDNRIVEIRKLELEWVECPPHHPATLLGEPKGKRGANQTSPDIAFVVGLKGGGQGLILTENKFVEHSFYPCSGRKKKYKNPDPRRCLDAKLVLDDLDTQCHLLNWETERRANRRYWEYVRIGDDGRNRLRRCPAATAGYQLFRQQALAEALAASGKYDLVVTSVAYDERNETLIGSMRGAGIRDFREDWRPLFTGKARFASFSHQAWIRWVRDNDVDARWGDWLEWVVERYELGE